MSRDLDVEIAARLGGSEGGWAFWSAMLAALELAAADSRGRRQAFSSYPAGELRRLLADVHDALGLAVTAVAAQELINTEPGLCGEAEWRLRLDGLLLERAREAALRCRSR